MRKLTLRSLNVYFIAAVLFVGGAFAQDDITPQRGGDRHKETAESAPQRVASFLAGIIVNDDGDATDIAPGDGVCETAAGNGICTLRAAIVEANALAGDDTITFDPSVTLIEVSGQIAITSNLTIIGPGPDRLSIKNIAAAGTTSRIFNITNFFVTITGVTLMGGDATVSGGAINNTGTLTLVDVAVVGNRSTTTGGGIRSTNTLSIYNSVINGNASTNSTSGGISFAGSNLFIANSTISGNTSFGNGGGMNVSASASMMLIGVTISGNTAGAASGGMFTNRGSIINSTISGNTANGALATEGGGGIRIQAGVNQVNITSSTITNNTAPNTAAGARSGIWHETGTLTLTNTIVAENVTQDIQLDGGTLVSGGFNLIGENTSVTAVFPAGTPSGTDYVGTDKSPLDPGLEPLGDNGGPTQTHALEEGSIAIDKGSSQGLTSDQRGYIRTIDVPGTPNSPTGDGTDIGSFEFDSMPNTAGFSVSGRVTDVSGLGIGYQRVVISDGTNVRYSLTSPFGYFRFENIAAGSAYVISVTGRRHNYTPRVIVVNADLPGIDFTAKP
jgi:predicted outer membrane repeat protein